MRWQQTALKVATECVSLARLPFSKKNGLRILTYHSIGSTSYEDYVGLFTVSIESFIQHMDVIASMQSVPLKTMSIPQSELKIAVTFDDGYSDNLYIAAPLLAARNIPYTVFVSTGFVKNKTKGFLNPSELKQLSIATGATIGAHSDRHVDLSLCNKKELKVELDDSKKYLEDLIGKAVTEFSYPYGIADMRVRDAVHEAGYQVAACSRFDVNKPDRDLLMLNRCVILSSDTLRAFQQKLSGDYDWARWRMKDPLYIKDANLVDRKM